MVLEQSQGIVLPSLPPMVLGTGIMTFCSIYGIKPTSIPCEGTIFRANVDTCSLGELQYQRDMFINS